jgi:hypothetical protein
VADVGPDAWRREEPHVDGRSRKGRVQAAAAGEGLCADRRRQARAARRPPIGDKIEAVSQRWSNRSLDEQGVFVLRIN